MNDKRLDITDLSKEELIRLVGIFMGDVLVHYGMWLTEVVHSLGVDTAIKLDQSVLPQYYSRAAARLTPHFGIEMEGNVPRVLASKTREELLLLLIADIAKTWLAGDGLWFQGVEDSLATDAANKVSDTCWSHFAYVEAHKIRQYLEIEEGGGLEALEKALKVRIYSSINAHSASWSDDGALLFTMTECRLQSARRGKDLEDYPCKSAGIIEYSHFAKGIDPGIKTECVWCPPDRVPDEEFCTWRFGLQE